MDPFLKIHRPDGKSDDLGLKVLYGTIWAGAGPHFRPKPCPRVIGSGLACQPAPPDSGRAARAPVREDRAGAAVAGPD